MSERNPLGWRRVLGPLGPRPRLTIAVLVGLATGLGLTWLAPQMQLSTRLVLGWDALSVTFLGTMLWAVVRHGPSEIRVQAALDDEGRGVILGLVLIASAASVWAVGVELTLAKDAHVSLLKAIHIVLAFLTVVASWLMVQMIFALHYAHEYYGVDEDDGARDAEGIEFPGHEAPDYWDFLYFSTVIGVACATADANITSKGLRQLAMIHGLVAFTFNTIIVALTINLTAGLF
ncbi:MAG TPA: DUF1345 domain-containing protein [Phenylobacterium sp.]|jgi:uncharacterized membrane protein|nr:DUF1345 domain-containing protein [Phenylobacterium sp.]